MSRDPMSGRLYVRQLINMDIPVYFRDIDTWTIDPVTGKKVRDAESPSLVIKDMVVEIRVRRIVG